MKAADTGRDPVTLSAMEQFVDDEMRIYQDPYASSMLTSSMRFFCGMSSKIDPLFRLNLTHPNIFGYGSVFLLFLIFTLCFDRKR